MFYYFYNYSLDEARRELRQAGQLVVVEPKNVSGAPIPPPAPRPCSEQGGALEQCWPETFVSEAALTRCLTLLGRLHASYRCG